MHWKYMRDCFHVCLQTRIWILKWTVAVPVHYIVDVWLLCWICEKLTLGDLRFSLPCCWRFRVFKDTILCCCISSYKTGVFDSAGGHCSPSDCQELYVHGSVRCESVSIIVEQGVTVYSFSIFLHTALHVLSDTLTYHQEHT